MPINNIQYNQHLAAQLDKAVTQKAQTGFFADNGLRAKFIGAKTVNIPVMGMSGLGDYDRDTGFARGGVNVSHTPFTLQMDRGTSLQIDAQDVDESGIPAFAAEVAAEFVRTKVIPEVDAYVLSKLAGVANEKGHTVTGTPASAAYKMLTEAIAKVQDAIGYDEELVAFVDGTFHSALMNTPEISRYLVTSDFKKGELNTKVKSLNGVAILPVESSRMKSAYTFKTGAGGADDFGFVPTSTAKSIGLLVLPKRGASLVKKTEELRTFSPKQNLNADAWKIDYRTYYDVFVKNSMANGIYAYTY